MRGALSFRGGVQKVGVVHDEHLGHPVVHLTQSLYVCLYRVRGYAAHWVLHQADLSPVDRHLVEDGKHLVFVRGHSSGTKIVPSSLSVKELTKFNTKKIPEAIKKLGEICDYVIIDSAAGFGDEVIAVLGAADEIIIVTNPEMPAVTDALKAVKPEAVEIIH